MKKIAFSLILVISLCFCVSPVFGFSTHNATITRIFDKVEAPAGESITVKVSFKNEEAYGLRGFYYTEQIPDALSVNRESVKINGSDIAYLIESDSSGDIYPGYIPYRRVLEIPNAFQENNSISENSTVEIVYSVTSSQPGAFSFHEFNWVGYYQSAPEGERAAFGHSDDIDRQTITFTAHSTQYTLTVNTIGQGNVTLDPPGDSYLAGTVVKLTPVPSPGWAFNGWSDDLTGYSNPSNIVMNTDKEIIATFDLDSDDDGISDSEEDGGPNNGDGNDDGTQDSSQNNVASFHTQDGTDYVTLLSTPGTLAGCRAVSPPSGCPTETNFPYGFFAFRVNGAAVPPVETVVTLYLPAGANLTTYYKHGPTPTNQNDHWYQFLYDGETGAEINGNEVTLHFIDSERGDDILAQDGMIIDQGGPGVPSGSGRGTTTGAGGGGGCFVATVGSNFVLAQPKPGNVRHRDPDPLTYGK